MMMSMPSRTRDTFPPAPGTAFGRTVAEITHPTGTVSFYVKDARPDNFTRLTRWDTVGGAMYPAVTRKTLNYAFRHPSGTGFSPEETDAADLFWFHAPSAENPKPMMHLLECFYAQHPTKIVHLGPLMLTCLMSDRQRTIRSEGYGRSFDALNTEYEFEPLDQAPENGYGKFFLTGPGALYAGNINSDRVHWVTFDPANPAAPANSGMVTNHDLGRPAHPANILNSPHLIRDLFAAGWLTPDSRHLEQLYSAGYGQQIEQGTFLFRATA